MEGGEGGIEEGRRRGVRADGRKQKGGVEEREEIAMVICLQALI